MTHESLARGDRELRCALALLRAACRHSMVVRMRAVWPAVSLLLGVAGVGAQVDINGFTPPVVGRCISGHNQGGSCECLSVSMRSEGGGGKERATTMCDVR
eukprot:COSAG02_NODE_3466_length_6694_cov_4.717665_1_plen_101_part_00